MLGAQDRGPGTRQLIEELGDRHRPGRVELRGRLVEDEHGRAHRHDARDGDTLLLAAGQGERFAVGEMADRQPSECRVDPRVHLVARDAQVLEPEGELLPDRQLRCGQLVRRRREDDPHPPEKRPGGCRDGILPLDDDPAADLRLDHARDEPGRRECQRGLARAGPPGDADALPGRHGHADPFDARLAAAWIADRQVLHQQGRTVVAGGRVGRHRPSTPIATSTITTAATRIATRSHRSTGGSATIR